MVSERVGRLRNAACAKADYEREINERLSFHCVKHRIEQTKRRPTRTAQTQNRTLLARNFLQLLLVNVEVGVNTLHVVVVFDRFQQADHLVGSLSFQLDVILRDHSYF